MKLHHFAAFVATLAMFPLAASAEPLSLDEAVRMALERNPSVGAAREAVAAASAIVDRAKADRRPAVDFTAGAREFETHAFLPSGLTPPGGAATIGPTEDWSVALEGRWIVYDGGRGEARVESTRAAHAASEQELAATRAQLALAVHRAYRAMEAALAARQSAQSRLARSADHVRLAQSRLDAGASPPADVTRARVEQANARAGVAAAEGDVRTAAAALNALLGAPAEAEISIVSGARGDVDAEDDLAASIESALARRPEILAARRRLDARSADAALAAAGSAPTADLRGRFGVRDEDILPSDRDASIGVNISKSLFDGGRRRAEVARARAEVRGEEEQLSALSNEIRRGVVEAHARLTEMREREAAATIARDAAAEGVRLMRARYEAGAAPIGELLDASSELDAAEAATIAARAAVEIARATLAHGRGDFTPP